MITVGCWPHTIFANLLNAHLAMHSKAENTRKCRIHFLFCSCSFHSFNTRWNRRRRVEKLRLQIMRVSLMHISTVKSVLCSLVRFCCLWFPFVHAKNIFQSFCSSLSILMCSALFSRAALLQLYCNWGHSQRFWHWIEGKWNIYIHIANAYISIEFANERENSISMRI